jgi:hypothetical protein
VEAQAAHWVRDGRAVGVYRIYDVKIHWGIGNFDCFILRGDEVEFGFLHSLAANPAQFEERERVAYASYQLWGFQPDPKAIKEMRKRGEPTPLSSAMLRQWIWDWLKYQQFDSEQDRRELKMLLAENDRFHLNNLFWITHSKVHDRAQKERRAISEGDFDIAFWRVLDAIANFSGSGDLPSEIPKDQYIRPTWEASSSTSKERSS